MPFGHKCEYTTFESCLTDQRKKGYSMEAARRICGSLQRDTEEKCKRKRSAATSSFDREPARHRYVGPETP